MLVAVSTVSFIVVPSRLIPGFRGTPAGMRTISAPDKHSLSPDGVGSYPLTVELVLMCEISAATPVLLSILLHGCRANGPGPSLISYSARLVTRGLSFINNDNG